MRIQTSPKVFAKPRSAESNSGQRMRIGIPRVLSQWSTHQFWTALFRELGVRPRDIVYSSETSESQQLKFGQGRGVVDCCYPVKCLAGHYGELLNGQKRKIDVLFSPMISSLPSFMRGHVVDNLSCPRVMAAPENAKAGFLREKDLFSELGVQYVSPFVSLAEPALAAKQLHEALTEIFPDLTKRKCAAAVEQAYTALDDYENKLRSNSRKILERCIKENRPCILALGRPYHMDTGIGHDIESDLQVGGYPILWGQYLPIDQDILNWMFKDDIASGYVKCPLDISEIWKSSYSANTNELLWAARFGAKMPWIACAIRFSSYECGMDQPTYTPVQSIIESSGTLFFAFQELDATKAAGSVKIRVETIAHYLAERSTEIIANKQKYLPKPNWV